MIFLVNFLLFFLPLLIFPFGFSPFETPKVIVTEAVVGLMLFFTIFKSSRVSFKKHDSVILVAIILLLSLSIFHIIFLRTPTTFFGNTFRLQGVFLLWSLVGLSTLSSQVKLKKISYQLAFFSFTALFVATFLFGANEAGRAIGTLGEPNALAATGVFLWPFLFFKSKRRSLKLLVLLAAEIIVVFSGSRSGLISFLLQLIFLILGKKIKIPLSKSLLICLIILGFSLFLPIMEIGSIFENRLEIWRVAWRAGWQNPFLGGGFGNNQQILNESANFLKLTVQRQNVDSSHNILLDWWTQAGITGIILFCVIIGRGLRNMVLKTQWLEITAFLGIITALSFNPASVASLAAFWWLIGQGLIKK